MMQANQSKIFFLGILSGMMLFSCTGNKAEKKKEINPKVVKESLIKANKKVVKTEEQEIRDFINRYGWTMQKTGSGLRYKIIREGNGDSVEKWDIVHIDYSVQFLTGDTLEKSEDGKPFSFMVGKDDVISGLHEGILLLQEGDEAIFIIPSHLAYGFTGKPGKIPLKTTLIYNVKVLEIN